MLFAAENAQEVILYTVLHTSDNWEISGTYISDKEANNWELSDVAVIEHTR